MTYIAYYECDGCGQEFKSREGLYQIQIYDKDYKLEPKYMHFCEKCFRKFERMLEKITAGEEVE